MIAQVSEPSRYRQTRATLLLILTLLSLSSCVGSDSPQVSPSTPMIIAPTTIAPITQTATAPQAPVSPPATRVQVPTSAPVATRNTPTDEPILFSLEERRQLFEDVWITVADNYLYPDLHGLDWPAMHEEYVQRVESANTREDFYTALTEMVAQLNDQHSRFVPPMQVPAEDASASGREVTVGIGIVTRARADGAFIQIVFPNSPAERAGIRTRDRIIAVDNRPYITQDGDLEGIVGSLVRLTVVRPGEKARDIVLERQEVASQIAPYARRFPGDIGYVSIPTLWAHDMGEQVSGALTDLRAIGPLRGVIIDVRANRGGWGEVLNDVLSHFVRGQIGTFFGRDHTRPLFITPPAGPDLRRVPLVVLVDSDTASYAEVLAAVLQKEAGALVVGAKSAGNTETIYAHAFEDGSRLWLAQEGFRLRDGTTIEGVGVLPDVSIESDWTRYSEDDDPQLLEALRLLGGGPK